MVAGQPKRKETLLGAGAGIGGFIVTGLASWHHSNYAVEDKSGLVYIWILVKFLSDFERVWSDLKHFRSYFRLTANLHPVPPTYHHLRGEALRELELHAVKHPSANSAAELEENR